MMKKPKNKNKKIVVAVSGGFDPIHYGHTRQFEAAKKLGDELVVILNNDNWMMKKKGYIFMPEKERAEIIAAFRSVDRVVLTKHLKNPKDMSVCEELRRLRPAIFGNGGDRKPDWHPVPEVALCQELGIKMVYNLGRGGKVQSSSWLTKRYEETIECFCKSGKKYRKCHGVEKKPARTKKS